MKYELKEEFKDLKKFTVPKLKKGADGESGTTTVDRRTFLARADQYIELGLGHYFEGGREKAKELKPVQDSRLIITYKEGRKGAKAAAEKAAKANKGSFENIEVIAKKR